MSEQTRTKILYFITKSNWGGAQRYVYDLATSLPANYEPVVMLGGNGVLIEKLQASGIRVIQIPGLQRDISFTTELSATGAIWRIIKAEKPAVLHVNSSKAGGLGALLGRLTRVPNVVFTAHGWAFNEDRPYWQKVIIKYLHWLTVFLAHRTIAVSHGMKEQMDWPLVQNKMTVIHPGRSISDQKNKVEARTLISTALPQLQAHQGDVWLGTVAELHPIKRLERAITAMSSLIRTHPQLRYVIIGDGQLLEPLTQQIKDLNLEGHVFLAGAIPEAGRLMKAFDVFVLPSKSESYGYVLVEAGVAGVPVVSTQTGGITDLVTNRESGLLVEPDDTPALTQALLELLENESLRHTLAEAHHKEMLKKTVTAMTEATLLVYEQ